MNQSERMVNGVKRSAGYGWCPGATVSIQFTPPVRDGDTEVESATETTDHLRRFAFAYDVTLRETAYSVTVEKVGYGGQVTSGVAKPKAQVLVYLERSATDE